jgi:hypothetical protein
MPFQGLYIIQIFIFYGACPRTPLDSLAPLAFASPLPPKKGPGYGTVNEWSHAKQLVFVNIVTFLPASETNPLWGGVLMQQ